MTTRPPDFLERLEALWNQREPQLSTREICTRMAISTTTLQKILSKTGWPRRPSPIQSGGAAKPQIRRVKGPTLDPLPSLSQPLPTIRPSRAPLECQWVLSERPFKFCGADCLAGKSYCVNHYSVTTVERRPGIEPLLSKNARG